MVRLRTLGALDLRDGDGHPIAAVLAQPKRMALLVHLALATPRGPHRRDALLPLFWPELDEEHARNALSQAVHFLRRSIGGDVIESGPGDEVGLRAGSLWCDAIAFEDALADGRRDEALRLYGGPFLDGFHAGDSAPFERWIEGERHRLADAWRRAVEENAEASEEAGDFAGAVASWRRLAVADLYSSRIALRLMQALAAAGDRAGALQHASIHQTLLRQDLEIEPDPAIAAFVARLQAERAASGPVGARGVSAASDGDRS